MNYEKFNKNLASKLYAEGMTAYQKGRYADAERLFAQLLTGQPGHADAWHMRGVCCMLTNRLGEAESFIHQALAIRRDASFYANLGLTLTHAKKADEAIAAYRAGFALDPDSAKVCANLARLLNSRGENQEAEALYRKAIALDPGYANALANLGILLWYRRTYAEAETLLRRSLALQPTRRNAAETLSMILEKTGRAAQATVFLEQAQHWSALGGNLRKLVAWQHLADADAACIADLATGRQAPSNPWQLLNIPALTPALLKAAALRFADEKFGPELALTPLVSTAPARAGPLRIGYLSADFRDHAVMHVLAGVLEAHDPTKVEVHLLSLKPAQNSGHYASRIAAMPVRWHDLSAVTDDQAVAKIVEIAPHLLIDLMGYTADARLNITARRPAPVIASWLGYAGTLGHERLADYIISDAVVTPPGHAGDFSETLALMPHCYQPNDRSRSLDPPPARNQAGLPETGFVFCSFNQFIKINPGTFDIWCRLLSATPGSVLWLRDENAQGMTHLKRETEKRGVSSDRLIFAARQPLAKHLARLQLADLALDTFPYNSHATASDVLWAGVPLVTRIGQTFASRVAASLLTTHGFPELIVQDDEAYFQLALSLVKQPERLRQLRQKLAAARLSSPLFDTVRFARDLERLYEAIWQQQGIPRDQRRPIVLPPGAVDTNEIFHRAVAHHNRGELRAAIACYDELIGLQADHAHAHYNRGNALYQLGRHEEALTSYDRAIAIKPDYAQAYSNRGSVLYQLGRNQEALASCDRAIALKPDSADAFSNRGSILNRFGRHEEALASCERAVALMPDFVDAQNNRGSTLSQLGRHEEALAAFERTLAIRPQYTRAQISKALHLILLGNYQDGFANYEERWRGDTPRKARGSVQTQWRGEPVADKTLLLYSEQGLGDDILMLRYLPLVQARAAHIVLELPEKIIPLLGPLADGIDVRKHGAALPPFDVHCSLMSLPFVFGTRVDSIPAQVPYLTAPAGRVAAWRARLPPSATLRVGLVSSTFLKDPKRSIAPDSLAPLFDVSGVSFVGLQPFHKDDLGTLSRFPIENMGDELANLGDAAAVIALCDLIIAVDTTVAHIAGALGKPLWVLLPYVPDWRWLLDRTDSPWYPTARLFRQGKIGDWASVIADVVKELSMFRAYGLQGRKLPA